MKNEDSHIKALGAKRYNPQKSILNFALSSNYGVKQIVESKDDALCMYDHAKEVLELMSHIEGGKLDG